MSLSSLVSQPSSRTSLQSAYAISSVAVHTRVQTPPTHGNSAWSSDEGGEQTLLHAPQLKASDERSAAQGNLSPGHVCRPRGHLVVGHCASPASTSGEAASGGGAIPWFSPSN